MGMSTTPRHPDSQPPAPPDAADPLAQWRAEEAAFFAAQEPPQRPAAALNAPTPPIDPETGSQRP